MKGKRDEDRADRQAGIAELVMTEGTVRIDDLASSFGVSLMTIHRDLDALANQGVLRKARGAATALSTTRTESTTAFRMRRNLAEKRAVAAVALGQVEPGTTIILDDSTTGTFLAQQLQERQPLTVITNFESVMSILQHVDGVNLISLGGLYYPWCNAYLGNITLTALQNLRADTFFMSTSAIIDGVCYHQHHDTVLVKKAAFDACRQRILYVDHEKFETRAMHALLPVSAFDLVIVGGRTDPEQIRSLRSQGVNVVVAPDDAAVPPLD